MSSIQPLVRGPVRVSWSASGEVAAVEYESEPLIVVTNRLVRALALMPAGEIVLPDPLLSVITNMLDAVIDSSNSYRQSVYLADKLFEHLNVQFNPPNPKLGAAYWSAVIQQVWRWEDLNQHIHKGSAYYFLGANFLGLGDIPSAYISLFSALEEDKRNYPSLGTNFKASPAYKTTSLIDDRGNALYPSVVAPLRSDLQGYLATYLALSSSNLDMSTLDSKFLQNDQLEYIKRFFVANFHEIYHLTPINSTRMINNDYSKTKVIDTLFNLGLVVDQTLEYRFSAIMGKRNMANAVHQLWLNNQWTTERDVQRFLRKFAPDPNSGTLDQILPAYLDGAALYDSSVMDAKRRAVLVAYILRNYSGHHLEASSILVSRYSDVLRNMMHALLTAVDSLQ